MNTAKRSKRLLSILLAAILLVSGTAMFAAAETDDETFQLVTRYEDGDLWVDGFTGDIPVVLTIPVEEDCAPYINESAFENVHGLEELILPKGAVGVSERAFANCVDLREVTIDLAWVDVDAFEGCTALETIYITAYDYDMLYGEDISYYWAEGNIPLESADRVYVNYLDWETFDDVSDMTLKVGEGLFVYSTFHYSGTLDQSFEYHWYYAGGPDDVLSIDYDGTMDDVAMIRTYNVGTEGICCAVTDEDGIVVYQEVFYITSTPTLKWRIQNFWYNSLLYRLIGILRNLFSSIFNA